MSAHTDPIDKCEACNVSIAMGHADTHTVDPQPKQRWKVRPKRGGPWLYVTSLDEMGDSDDGNEYDLESVWLTDSEVAALPEFDGW